MVSGKRAAFLFRPRGDFLNGKVAGVERLVRLLPLAAKDKARATGGAASGDFRHAH